MADGADDANHPNADDVFTYTTGSIVPDDVVRVRVHPSVTVIPANAFMDRRKLEEVELPDGLLEIGLCAFQQCSTLKRMKIPSTLRKIGVGAFMLCIKLEEVELCEGLLEIGNSAFSKCKGLKRINIPSTVTIIEEMVYHKCYQLEEVELCEGLLEIRREAFSFCRSLKHINLPATIRRLGTKVFFGQSSLLSINLPDGIESIGEEAFLHGGLLTFRVPPLITTIPLGMVELAESLFSVELSESVTYLEGCAFSNCYSLRNVAIPQNDIEMGQNGALRGCKDLLQLFGSTEDIVNALKHRFDNLPIHKMLYYQSYESVRLEQLNNATNIRNGQSRSSRSKLDPTGKQQDCLGMTSLHILACSSVQDLELYKVLVEKYPENLITEDRWGALPLLYAVWGNAPSEIVQYLVESYQSIYPEYELDWTKMVKTLGRGNAPKEVIQKLLDVQKDSFPEQNIDWGRLIENAVSIDTRMRNETFGYLVQFSLAPRIDAIGLKQWRDAIKHTTENCDETGVRQRRDFITEVTAKLAHYEAEYHNLKEAMSLLELALWKQKMNDHILGEKKRHRKKTKIDDSNSIREQSRISCGADIVIQHMLPYLLPRPVVYTKIHNFTIDSSSESDDESESDISHL